jgi:hypothetical protein
MSFLHVGSSATYWKLLPLLGPVADLQLSAPTEEEEKDLDLLEERKILCFLEAISNLKTVGVDLAGKDPMELEKWPLIQVYGVEELGGVPSVLASLSLSLPSSLPPSSRSRARALSLCLMHIHVYI